MDGKTAAPEGFLNVCKPHGWTSHDVVQLVRRLAGTRRVGHAGTLDPAAAGVLPIAVGRATRLVNFLADQDKCYCGDVVLGAATSSDDAEGIVLYARDPSSVSLESAASALAGFLGEIEQLPPQYSAVKLQGRKAYEIARSGGSAKLTPRRVTIKGLAVVGWEPPVLSLMVTCSKGTYIRSLARDLGERLGVGGHLGALVRLTSGRFEVSDAIGIEDLRLAAEFGYLEGLIYPPDVAVVHLPAVIVAERHARDMLAGRAWVAQASGTRHQAPDQAQDTRLKAQGDAGMRGRGDAEKLPLPLGEGRVEGQPPPLPLGEGRGEGCTHHSSLITHHSSQSSVLSPERRPLVRVYSEDGAFLGLAQLVDGNWQPRLVMGEE